MPTRRRQRFVHAQAGWMLATLLVLAVLGALRLERLFVRSLIGLLGVIELTAPFNVTPRWRKRLKWLVALGLVVFVIVVVRRILAILPQGVF
jgi:dolichyl-phosphate-mannose--protein O-mannosyl transferase